MPMPHSILEPEERDHGLPKQVAVDEIAEKLQQQQQNEPRFSLLTAAASMESDENMSDIDGGGPGAGAGARSSYG